MEASLQEYAEGVLDALRQAVLIAEPSGAIVYRNAAAEAMLPEGGTLDTVLTDDGVAVLDVAAALSAGAGGGDSQTHRSVRVAGRGKRELTVDIHLRPLAPASDAKGGGAEKAMALIVVEDVSSRLTMERRLASSERLAAAGQIAARVAHELNNPLDGVLRYVGLAKRAASSRAKKLREYLEGARCGLARMVEIIKSLRAEGGEAGSAAQRPAQQLLEEAIVAMQPRADALGVAVACDLDAGADAPAPVGVFQVFCNVIKNALDAMADGGLLSIRLAREGSQCVVEFADTGCGIGNDECELIFEPFYTTKPAGEGLGLGLAVSREILSRAAGSIAAAPQVQGGTIVTVRLPAGR